MSALTERQLEIFRFIEAFITECGYPPTRKDICQQFGFSSMNAAEQHLQAIAAKGKIRLMRGASGRGISRGIVLVDQPPPNTASASKGSARK